MSPCADVRRLILEAEPDALAGRGDGPVAEHVRECAACAAVARVILDDTAALDRFLAAQPSAPDVDAILAAAGVLDAPGAADVHDAALRLPVRRWTGWLGLAAAAVVAGLMILNPRGPRPTPLNPGGLTPPLVEASSHENVAVMATANPDITVVWFY